MPAAPPALPPALDGERRAYRGRAGDSSAYLAGPQRAAPLLLLHSVNAAASAYEVKPIYDRMATERRVLAPDLPGFGFSDRSRRDYTIRLYTDSVHDALDLVAADSGNRPVDVLAVSLASEFAARATLEAPARVRSLTLVTPTGFARNVPTGDANGGSREVPGLYRTVSFPLWGRPLFDLLTSRTSIRYFLRRTYGSRDVDEAMVEYDWLSTRPPGAENAPFAFLSGRLFSRDVQAVYRQLELPVWVPHATRGDFRDFSRSDWARARSNWRFQPMPTGAMPHFEQPEAFVQALRAFLAAAG
jgi:pimeloyl-ACP methyl ester carboxylesterase